MPVRRALRQEKRPVPTLALKKAKVESNWRLSHFAMARDNAATRTRAAVGAAVRGPFGHSVVVGDLLIQHVPALTRGEVQIVAIARYVSVLSKVAIRRRPGMRLSARPVTLVVGLGADYVNRVSAVLDGERLHMLQWQGDPVRYVAEALGLGYMPPITLSPTTRLANVLLGDID